MLSSAMGYADDVVKLGWRGLFRPTGNSMMYSADRPGPFFNALRSGRREAITTMEKIHYGAFYNEGKRTIFSGLAERELLMKGKGFSGAIFGRPMKGFSVGMGHLKGFAAFALAGAAVESYSAGRGHKLSAAIGGVSKFAAYSVGDVIGSLIGGPLVGAALGVVTEKAGAKVEEAFQFLHDFHRMVSHINMGGNYEDTQIAYTMRQRAAREMGSSVMNARTWLGKEGALMHQ